MKFYKKSIFNSLSKIITLVLLGVSAYSQNTGPATGPTTGPTNAPTTAPATAPATNPQTTTPNMPVTNRTRVIPNDPNAVRNVTLLPTDQTAMTTEDSIRMAREQADLANEQLIALRKRIFGFNFFNTGKFDPNPVVNIATPSNYVLGPNDQLLIDVYGYSQENIKATVSPDGYITLPRVGLVYVSGSSIEQAKERIVSRLSKFYIGLRPYGGNPANTFCNVSLGNIRTIKVTATGEVMYPGTYTLPSLSTAMTLLYYCGGPNEIGTFRKIQVIRQNRVVATLDLYELLMNGTTKSNVLLQDQDVLQIVPYISRVAIQGNTKRSGLFELLPNEKIDKAIYYAGGFNPYAYTHKLKLHRNTARERKIFDIDERAQKEFEVMTGDSIVIERILERYENMVNIEGAVFRPGQYSLDSNPTLTQLIKSAEGLRGEALTGRISILRTLENMSVENLAINLDDVLKGKVNDIALKREDLITIPSMFDLIEPAFIRISGAINNPAAVEGVELPFVRNMTIEDVLVKVGGLSESASLSKVEVVRRKRNVDATSANAQISDRFEFTINPDLKIDGRGDKFILFPFDEIFIRRSPNYVEQTFVEINGEVFYPAKYGIQSKDEKISDIIKRAGGLTPQAYIEGATLIRKVSLSEVEIAQRRRTINEIQNSTVGNQTVAVDDIDPTRSESIGVDLKKAMSNPGSVDDMILQDGDVIQIPKRLETVRIQGEVLYPTTVKYLNGASFQEYISRAGGFNKRSLKSKAYVLYANGSVDRTRKFLFVNVYPKVEPGSEIIIPQKTVNTTQQIAQAQNLLGTIGATITTLIGILGIFRLSN
ncbi:MAG: SLBB domain-containing protein [Spirosomaceae bacterium]|nr:SLBB domain-containing protein [Spirosomataceae bacterium]